MIAINLPSFKSNDLNYITVEIVNNKEEKPIKRESNKPKSPKEKTFKKAINPSLSIDKPINIPVEKPKIKEPQKEEIEKLEMSNDRELPDLPPTKPIEKQNVFDDMLKNLAEEEPIEEVNQSQEKNEINTAKTASLTPSIIRKIFKQIKDKYEFPPAMEKSEAISVKIRIYLRTDGTIIKIVRSKQALNSSKDPKYLSYLEAAERALRKLEKFDGLPTDEYSIWKVLEIDFYPYGFN